MKIVSIQVGLPRTVTFHGKQVTTGIFKDQVPGPVLVRTLNLAGDQQADLTVHGGVDKAVYAYSLDAYPWWKQERPGDSLEHGAFGENLTVDEMPEDKVFIGDTFEVGSAVIQAAQPRLPCYKLGVKFNDPSVLKTFMRSGRPGVYFRVLTEGTISPGDAFKMVYREQAGLSVSELFSMARGAQISLSQAEEYSKISALPEYYREKFRAVVAAG